MLVGTSVDPRLGFAATDIADPPYVTWVRSVLKPDHNLTPWLNDCHAAGLKVLGVIARESKRSSWSYPYTARYYAKRYGATLDGWQLGNEPDQKSPSSWTMTQATLNRLLRAFRAALPDAFIVGPGLVSGQPAYLDGVDLTAVNAIALHPYGRGPSAAEPYAFGPVADLVQLYRRFGKPIWATEFGGPRQDFTSEHERADYHGKMLVALRDAGCEAALQFCWGDRMVDGFGLVDATDTAKESYAAFYDGARAVAGEPPTTLLHAIDVSSHQPRDLTAIIQQTGAQHVIVRMYLPWETPSQDISRAQVQSARDNGCSVSCYLWLYRTADPIATARYACELAEACGVEGGMMWVDLEPYTDGSLPTEAQTLQCLDAMGAFDFTAGVYTGAWVINGHMGGTHAFAGYPLWTADYSLEPDDLSAGYGGWESAVAHQFTSDPVDQSKILSDFT